MNQDIKNEIMTKIKNIESYSEWCKFDFRIDEENLSMLNRNDFEYQMNLWENIAKLSIDLWKDFDYYRLFQIESLSNNNDYQENLTALGCMECGAGRWKCVTKPSEDVVVKNVYTSFLYRHIYNSRRCPSEDLAGSSGAMRTERVTDWTDKWKCGKCEYISEYKYGNCAVCGALYDEGWWRCEQCSQENSAKSELCPDCGWKNHRTTTRVVTDCSIGGHGDICVRCRAPSGGGGLCDMCTAVDDCGGGGGNDSLDWSNRWRCRRCGLLQTGDTSACAACTLPRDDGGQWRCQSCRTKNKCLKSRCCACGQVADDRLELSNRCRLCGCRVESHRHGDCCPQCTEKNPRRTWHCAVPSCGQLNDIDDEYCAKCGLYVTHSRSRGASVARCLRGTRTTVWVCTECNTFNGESLSRCQGCRVGRHERSD